MKRLCNVAVWVWGAWLAAVMPAAWAAEYPERPVRLIVPWPAGGLVDIAARASASHLQAAFGQPVVVDNRPGAGGAIGADAVAKSAPDGYTLLLTTSALNMNAAIRRTPSYSVANEFIPIAAVAYAPSVLVVRNELGVDSVQALVAMARARPGKLSYASAGPGSPAHLYGELLKAQTGIYMVHVPYKGAPQAINDLIGGEVDVLFANAAVALPQIRGGRVRALAVTSAQRFPALSDLPTMGEAGLPRFNADQWLGILAPRGTPAAVVQRLRGEIDRMVVRDEVKAALGKSGMTAAQVSTSAEFASSLNREFETWLSVVQSANIKPE